MSTEDLGIDADAELSTGVGGVAEAEVEPESVPAAVTAPEPYREVRYVDVAVVLPSPNPVLLLDELDPPHRRVAIPIGMPEGVAIAHAARRTPTPRPLTHELFVEALESFGAVLETVRITAVDGAAFSAELLFSSPTGGRTLACRPSDAVALALRQRLPVPITVAEVVLASVGFEVVSGV